MPKFNGGLASRIASIKQKEVVGVGMWQYGNKGAKIRDGAWIIMVIDLVNDLKALEASLLGCQAIISEVSLPNRYPSLPNVPKNPERSPEFFGVESGKLKVFCVRRAVLERDKKRLSSRYGETVKDGRGGEMDAGRESGRRIHLPRYLVL
ncbi:hypothetical protein L218DRAFT_949420 [Marasmius fiardii PR-910]|nr:hypothetical protein L218DRAFT_949420 [Marasmius fiardii PR-910]